jgi:hypothetical protein
MNRHRQTHLSLPGLLRVLLAIAAVAVLPLALTAQQPDVDALYHLAARQYVDGAREEAETTALTGLAAEPGHDRLQALLDLIRRQSPPDPQAPRPEPPAEAVAPDEPDAPPDAQPPDADPGTGEPGAPGPLGVQGDADGEAMSREQAERILQALQAEERALIQSLQRHRTQPRRPARDW